jgi:ketosteroid isomerase-like protein
MPGTATQKRVLDLERQYWDAMKARDFQTVEKLTADPCIVVGADGVAKVTKKQLTEMLSSSDYHVKSYRIDEKDVHVGETSDDVAFVAYKIHEESERGGKPFTLEAFNSSVWIRNGGDWQCAMHTESLAPGSKR